MSGKQHISKSELLQEIDRDWAALQNTLSRLSREQLAGIRDNEGWSAKDHLSHIAAWERSVVFFLQGKPRHQGLGVEQSTYEDEDDTINAVVQQRTADRSLDDTLAELRDVHAQLLALLAPLSDSDLAKPYRAYLPAEPGDGDGPPALEVIRGNTSEHFREHLGWIKQMTNDEG